MIAPRTCARALAVAAVALAAAGTVSAYPEFQKFSQQTSGRVTNCAMCHVNPDGPEGTGHGQIGALTAAELARLNEARAAFDPGRDVDSPILNAFGDSILRTVGKTRFLQFRAHPAELAAALGDASDLDGDGISDAREFLDGTHPLKSTSGDPWKLLVTNASRYRFHLAMIVIATALGIFGLANLLRATRAAHDAAVGER